MYLFDASWCYQLVNQMHRCNLLIHLWRSGGSELFWWWANLLIWKLTCNDCNFYLHFVVVIDCLCWIVPAPCYFIWWCLLTSTCKRRIYPTNTRGHGVYVEWGQKNLTLENFSTQDRVEWKMRRKDTLAWGCLSLGILRYTLFILPHWLCHL